MMDFNRHWERWCKISIIEHFDAKRNNEFPMFVEGYERATEDLPEYFELRIDGPNTRENANKQWRLYFEVNVLIAVQEENDNPYRTSEMAGLITNAFTEHIPVYKYGTGPDDDGSLLGHLRLVPRAGERIQTSYFGKINPTARMLQSTVEGHYNIYFD